jgi:ABC-type uncharacterized transport system permease subunit
VGAAKDRLRPNHEPGADFSITPSVLCSLIGNVAVDRGSRAGLRLACHLARGLVALAVAMLGFAGRLEVWHVFIASLIFGLVDAFIQPLTRPWSLKSYR